MKNVVSKIAKTHVKAVESKYWTAYGAALCAVAFTTAYVVAKKLGADDPDLNAL